MVEHHRDGEASQVIINSSQGKVSNPEHLQVVTQVSLKKTKTLKFHFVDFRHTVAIF